MQLVWLRNDLRIGDNPALFAARSAGVAVAVWCVCAGQWRGHGMGPWRMAFLLRSVRRLSSDLAALGIPLRILEPDRFAEVPSALVKLAAQVGAERLHFNDEYPLDEQRRDDAVVRAFAAARVGVERHVGAVLCEPGAVRTQAGGMPAVYSAFRRIWLANAAGGDPEPLPPPPRQPALPMPPDPVPPIAGVDESALAELWPGGESEGRRRLQQFVASGLADYHRRRDLPAVAGTSRLSPYLAVGSLSARQALAAVRAARAGTATGEGAGPGAWRDELLWREFYQHLTAFHPRLSMGRAFKPETEAVAWRQSGQDLAAWQQGRTGYPLVDAGMRQLASTGWMHNRLRMVCAMFLSKHLLLDWRLGESWFMRHLVDGDFAANNGGWQWSASTGCDAVPYFRIFNPVRQARRFDPQGHFVRAQVPELATLEPPAIFEPWASGAAARCDYPPPLVDHRRARARALEAFAAVRSPRGAAPSAG